MIPYLLLKKCNLKVYLIIFTCNCNSVFFGVKLWEKPNLIQVKWQKSKKKLLSKIVNDWKVLTVFSKKVHLRYLEGHWMGLWWFYLDWLEKINFLYVIGTFVVELTFRRQQVCSLLFQKELFMFNPFLANVRILYPLKTLENLCFSNVFMGYKMGTLTRNEL